MDKTGHVDRVYIARRDTEIAGVSRTTERAGDKSSRGNGTATGVRGRVACGVSRRKAG